MISAFNTIKLRHLLKDFYQITHIRITVFDENRTEIVSYPDQIAPFARSCDLLKPAVSPAQAVIETPAIALQPSGTPRFIVAMPG